MTVTRGLRGRGHFASIRAWRCEGRSGPLRVLAAPSRGGDASLGLATPGMRGAVPRNRLRRRLRAAVREIMTASGYDLIVTADPAALAVPFAELRAHLEGAAGTALDRAASMAVPGPGAVVTADAAATALGGGAGDRG